MKKGSVFEYVGMFNNQGSIPNIHICSNNLNPTVLARIEKDCLYPKEIYEDQDCSLLHNDYPLPHIPAL